MNWRGLFALAHLADSSPLNQEEIMAKRGAWLLVAAMSKHSDASLQGQACETIYRLCMNSIANQTILGQSILDSVLSALKNHATDASVQTWGLRTLTVLCLQHGANQDAIGGTGMQLILSAMTALLHDENVQVAATWALAGLVADNQSNLIKLQAMEGEEIIEGVLKAHPTDLILQQQGEEILSCLREL